jgi:hypothetical protein
MTKDRRPLVDKGVHALLLPFRRKRGLEQKAFVAQTFGKWSLERAVDRFLCHLHRRRVVTGDRMRGLQRNLQKIRIRYDARNETEGLCLCGADSTAGKDEIHGKRLADRARQPL